MIATSNFVTNQMHNSTTTVVNNTTATIANVENITNNNNNSTNNGTQLVPASDEQIVDCTSNHYQEDNSIDNKNYNNNNTDENIEDCENHQQQNNEESVDITISNVVTNFSVRCHLNLRQIATNGSNVVYKREQSIILMKLRQPNVTASIWSSGKIICTGATTEESAKCASRKIARCLQKLGFRVKFSSYRIVNVLGACRLPFGIKIHEFSDLHRPQASYEPELHPGATYRVKELKAVLKIFQTGSITITAPSIRNVQLAVEHIYPLVYEFRKPKQFTDLCGKNNHHHHNIYSFKNDDEDNDDDDVEDVDTLLTREGKIFITDDDSDD